jgi:hypothetical protein
LSIFLPSRGFSSVQNLRRTMRSTRFYLVLLALVVMVLCTSSKGATATQKLARRSTIGPRRLDLVHPANDVDSGARGLESKPDQAMSRRVARSGQRASASRSLSPSSSSHAAGSSNDDDSDLPTSVVTSEAQLARRPVVVAYLKPNPPHPDAGTRTSSPPQLAKRCHYIGTFFRRSVFPVTPSEYVCTRGIEAETIRPRTALTATRPPIRHGSLTLMHPPRARSLRR